MWLVLQWSFSLLHVHRDRTEKSAELYRSWFMRMTSSLLTVWAAILARISAFSCRDTPGITSHGIIRTKTMMPSGNYNMAISFCMEPSTHIPRQRLGWQLKQKGGCDIAWERSRHTPARWLPAAAACCAGRQCARPPSSADPPCGSAAHINKLNPIATTAQSGICKHRHVYGH